MNHIGRKQGAGDGGMEADAAGAADAFDVADTLQHAPLSSVRARRIVRKVSVPSPESTEEVAAEDILLEAYEAYADVPAPSSPSITERMDPTAFAGQAASTGERRADVETPSVAAVAVAEADSVWAPAASAGRSHAPKPPSALFWTVAVLVVGAAIGGGVTSFVAARRSTYVASSPPAAPPSARAPRAPAPERSAVEPIHAPLVSGSATATDSSASAGNALESGTPGVPVESLPAPKVDPDATLVSFPPSAKSHRIYVDGALLGGRDGGARTTKLRCGRHTIKIGSAGRPRELDLPCGRELALR